MLSLAVLIDKIIDIYTWIVIASAIMSWLVAFGVVNISNKFIRMVVEVLYRLTEPVLRPIRRIRISSRAASRRCTWPATGCGRLHRCGPR